MTHIFRDPTEGATARRADLLRRRRDELVMMPHAIRRVFVARRARTAASLAIALTGIATLVIAAEPAWAAFLAQGLPGINPAVLCTGTVAMWLVGLFTYFAARAVDEHRFAVAMSKLVMPGRDVNEDVERLSHENPDQAARDMAHRLEVRSAALPVLAAGVVLPVTALYAAAVVRQGGWPVIADFEGSVARHATALLACAGAGGVLAIAMTKRATRLPIVGPFLALVSLGVALTGAFTTPWLVPVALIGMAGALVIRTLRKERDLLQAEDPAAGSEVFTIRGFFRGLRAAVVSPVAARVKQVKPVWVLVAGLLVIAGVTAMKLTEVERGPRLSDAKVSAAATPVARSMPTVAPTGSKSSVEGTGDGDGRLKITLDLVDDQPITIPSLAGLASIPPMWNARIDVKQTEGLGLQLGLFDSRRPFTPISIGTSVTVWGTGCGMAPEPMAMRVQGEPGHYVLFVQPTLIPADCELPPGGVIRR